MSVNYYKILGIPDSSSKEEIKKAYRRLVKIYHPDKTNNDPVKNLEFLTITKAYEMLMSNREKLSFESNALILYTEYDDDGNARITFDCKNILYMYPIGELHHEYYWTLASCTGGRVVIYKQHLKKVNYYLRLRFVGYSGEVIDAETQLQAPPTFIQTIINKLKNLF